MNKGKEELWLWFGLDRSSWLTLPRVLMHEMPDQWQAKMAELLNEYDDTFKNWNVDVGTNVEITGDSAQSFQWLNDYRHPSKNKIELLKSAPNTPPTPANPEWWPSNKNEFELENLDAVKADITRLDSELATVRAKMDGYLKELGL